MYINIYTAGAQPDGGEGRVCRSRASKGPTLHHALIARVNLSTYTCRYIDIDIHIYAIRAQPDGRAYQGLGGGASRGKALHHALIAHVNLSTYTCTCIYL